MRVDEPENDEAAKKLDDTDGPQERKLDIRIPRSVYGCKIRHRCDLTGCERKELKRLRDPAVLQRQNDGAGSQSVDMCSHSVVNADLRKDLRHNDQQLSLRMSTETKLGAGLEEKRDLRRSER